MPPTKRNQRGLTDLQRRYAEEYVVDANQTAAADRAGCSRHYATHTLMKHPGVLDYIATLQARKTVRTGIDADRVFTELGRVGLAKITDVARWDEGGVHFIPSDELTEDAAAAIESVKSKRTIRRTRDGDEIEKVELEVKMHSKLTALQEMGRHLGIASKHEVRLTYVELLESLPMDELLALRDKSDQEVIAYLDGKRVQATLGRKAS